MMDDHTNLEILAIKIDQLTELLTNTSKQAAFERERIIEQAKITNGRVRALELNEAKTNGAVSMLRWMVGLGLAVPGSIAAITTVLHLLNKSG